MVREFLGEGPVPLVPQTFDMTSLLHQINSTNTGSTGQRHKQGADMPTLYTCTCVYRSDARCVGERVWTHPSKPHPTAQR